jgi:hypothetical protein
MLIGSLPVMFLLVSIVLITVGSSACYVIPLDNPNKHISAPASSFFMALTFLTL